MRTLARRKRCRLVATDCCEPIPSSLPVVVSIQALVQAVEHEGSQSRRNELTERERGIEQEIGVQLSISEASVKSALQQLFVKTGVRTRSQLVRVALEEYGTAWGLR